MYKLIISVWKLIHFGHQRAYFNLNMFIHLKELSNNTDGSPWLLEVRERNCQETSRTELSGNSDNTNDAHKDNSSRPRRTRALGSDAGRVPGL